MDFRILGPLEVWGDGRQVPLHGRMQRSLLAALLLDANRVVSVDQLVDQLWGDAPPATARVTLQSHILRLRSALGGDRDRPGRQRLRTRSSGYLLVVEPGQLDLVAFQQHVTAAARARAQGRLEAAAECYRAAMRLWRGRALGDLAAPFAQVAAARLEEQRLTALEERIEVDLALGCHRELIAELTTLTASHPFRERLRFQLMPALYRAGRQVEALEVYREARRVLIEQVGLEPGIALRRLEQAILTAEPSLELAHDASVATAPEANRATPCLLPPDITDFTGRSAALAQLHDALTDQTQRPAALVVSAVAGKAGVGKTALAVHLAHRVRAAFPDGQLYANLRGGGPQPLDPAVVLSRFLRALGVDGAAIPSTVEERAGMYRAQLADRRLLVVLDDAASESQVRTLLPGGGSCAVLLTSRRRLTGLEGAHAVALEVLRPDEAVDLLTRIVGAERVAAEPEAARVIARLCGYLPLALRIAGAKLAARHHWSLTRMVERLADERRRLEELKTGDLDVRASLTLSYTGLGQEDRRAFRFLGVLDAADFPAWVAAALLEVHPLSGEDIVERLVDAQLLEAAGRDQAGQTRYRFHDLLRAFARELLRHDEPTAARQEALERLLGTYLALAATGAGLVEPGGLALVRPVALDRWLLHAPEGESLVKRDPLGWFAAERASLVSAVEQARQAGLAHLTVDLAACLVPFFEVRVHWDDWQHTHELAREASRKAGDRLGEADAMRNLANLYLEQSRLSEAAAVFERCLPVFRELDDRRREAHTLCSLGTTYRDQGHHDPALACLEASLVLFCELGDQLGASYVRRDIGNLLREQRRYGEALPYYEQALVEARELGDRLGEAQTLRCLGLSFKGQRRWDEAAASLEACLRLTRQLGNRRGEAYTLRSLGEVSGDQGDYEQAVVCLEQSRALVRELGDVRGEAATLYSLGEVHRDRDEHAAARTCFEQSVALFSDLHFDLWESKALSRLGEMHRRLGDEAAARAAWRRALPTLRRLSAPEATEIQTWLAE
jgi:DNA-binding SARP family transcriptional activator